MNDWTSYLEQHRWRAITGVLVLLACYVLLTDALPRMFAVTELYATWQAHQTKIAAVATWERQEKTLDVRRQHLQQRLDRLYVSLPQGDQMSAVLQVFQSQADASGVRLQRIQPDERMVFENHDELPLHIELTGRFHALETFIHATETSAFLIKVKKVALQRASPTSPALEATLLGHVILLKGQGGQL